MIGGVRIRTELGDGGRTRIAELTATAPFAAKITGDTIHLIGSAAAPLDGDQITIDMELGDGTQLTIRTVAATMAWPGRGASGPSVMELRARVGEGALLQWLPEPLVPVRRCRHVLRTNIELARTARLVWREEIVLGRAGEGPGTMRAETRVLRAGEPLLHQHLAIDGDRNPSHRSAALLGQARATGGVLVVGPGAPEHCSTIHTPELRGAVHELEGGGRLASATATSVPALRRWLDEREAGLTAGSAWTGEHHGKPGAPPAPHDRKVAAS